MNQRREWLEWSLLVSHTQLDQYLLQTYAQRLEVLNFLDMSEPSHPRWVTAVIPKFLPIRNRRGNHVPALLLYASLAMRQFRMGY